MFFYQYERLSFTPARNYNRQNNSAHFIILFEERRHEDKRLRTEGSKHSAHTLYNPPLTSSQCNFDVSVPLHIFELSHIFKGFILYAFYHKSFMHSGDIT